MNSDDRRPALIMSELYQYLAKDEYLPAIKAGWDNLQTFLTSYRMGGLLPFLQKSSGSTGVMTLDDDSILPQYSQINLPLDYGLVRFVARRFAVDYYAQHGNAWRDVWNDETEPLWPSLAQEVVAAKCL